MTSRTDGGGDAGLPPAACPEAQGQVDPAAAGRPAPARKKSILVTGLTYIGVVIAVCASQPLMAPRCTSTSVTNTVSSILEGKLLHVAKFSVALIDIRSLDGDFFFGDRRCSAGLTVGGRPSPRTVEYRWTGGKRGALGTVYAKLR